MYFQLATFYTSSSAKQAVTLSTQQQMNHCFQSASPFEFHSVNVLFHERHQPLSSHSDAAIIVYNADHEAEANQAVDIAANLISMGDLITAFIAVCNDQADGSKQVADYAQHHGILHIRSSEQWLEKIIFSETEFDALYSVITEYDTESPPPSSPPPPPIGFSSTEQIQANDNKSTCEERPSYSSIWAKPSKWFNCCGSRKSSRKQLNEFSSFLD